MKTKERNNEAFYIKEYEKQKHGQNIMFFVITKRGNYTTNLLKLTIKALRNNVSENVVLMQIVV